MSINVSVGVMIPANVVEVGDEITADQLSAIQNASVPSSANPYVTVSTLVRTILTGSNTVNASSNSHIYVIDNSETLTVDDSPPVGTVIPVVCIGGTACNIGVAFGSTLNGGTATISYASTVKTLVKTATNTWWIG